MKPVAIERDAMGWWEHPQLEASLADAQRGTPHERENARFLMTNFGLEVMHMPLLPSTDPDANDNDLSKCAVPAPPGPDWFCILIWAPDNLGPTAWFARKTKPQNDMFNIQSAQRAA